MSCPYADDWKNQEGWLIFGDKLVCLDFDDYCVICRKDDSEDYVFDIKPEYKVSLSNTTS